MVMTVRPPRPVPLASCDVPGSVRGEIFLEFTTVDNARSLTRILAAWDDAGYLPDRATRVNPGARRS